jgi:glycosyltransferase involved in cell wall biosynthesis
MKKKVALFISIRSRLGGAERRLPRLFAGIAQEDILVRIIILQLNDNEEVRKQFRSLINDKTEIIFLSNLFSVIIHLLKEKYDWVCCFSPGFRNVIVFFAAMISGSKRVFTSVSAYTSELIFESLLKKVRFFLMGLLSNRIDCLYPSSTARLQIAFPNQIVTTTPGTFTDLKKYLPAVNKEKLIVFASRMVEGKNPDLMARAICLIQDKIRNEGFKFVFCGDGPELSKTKEILRNGNCLDIVELPGDVNMSLIFPKAKVFCSLQSITNYPSQSLVEAMASGCYCIATNTGDTKLMVHSEFGKLVEVEAESLAKAIEESLFFPTDKWDQIKLSSRKFVEDSFSLDVSVKHYLYLFM